MPTEVLTATQNDIDVDGILGDIHSGLLQQLQLLDDKHSPGSSAV